MNKKYLAVISSLFFLFYSGLSFASASTDFTLDGKKISPVCVWTILPPNQRYSGFSNDGKYHLDQIFLDKIPQIKNKTVDLTVCQSNHTTGETYPDGPGIIGYSFPWRSDMGPTLLPHGSIDYKAIGKTANGHIVLWVSQGGDGNAQYDSIALVDLKKEKGVTYLQLYSIFGGGSSALKGLELIDTIIIKGNTLIVRGVRSGYDIRTHWVTRTVDVSHPIFAVSDG